MSVAISRAGPEAVDRLRPLWLVLHRHHQAVGGPALGPYVDDDTSWAARRDLYDGFFRQGGFAVLAERYGELIGYAMAAITPVAETLMPDTWRTGDRIAEVETLSSPRTPAARASAQRCSTGSTKSSRPRASTT